MGHSDKSKQDANKTIQLHGTKYMYLYACLGVYIKVYNLTKPRRRTYRNKKELTELYQNLLSATGNKLNFSLNMQKDTT